MLKCGATVDSMILNSLLSKTLLPFSVRNIRFTLNEDGACTCRSSPEEEKCTKKMVRNIFRCYSCFRQGGVGGWSSLKIMIVYLVEVLNIYSGASGRGCGWVEGGRESMVRKEGARDLEGGRGIFKC